LLQPPLKGIRAVELEPRASIKHLLPNLSKFLAHQHGLGNFNGLLGDLVSNVGLDIVTRSDVAAEHAFFVKGSYSMLLSLWWNKYIGEGFAKDIIW